MKSLLRLIVLGAGLLAAWPALARETTDLLTGWKFMRLDANQPDALYHIENVTLPHTWNAADGHGGLKPHPEFKDGYYRGPAEYERMIDAPPSWKGKRVFIRFEAASTVARVNFNGQFLGEHRGGFTAFCYELTPYLKFDAPNNLDVRVDNSERDDVPPLVGDFNVDGGLYRPVELIVADPVCISPLDDASPGVYLTPKLGDLHDGPPQQAMVEVKAIISNGELVPVNPKMSITVKDAGGKIVANELVPKMREEIGPGETMPITMPISIDRPHLWNGREDPYLYTVTVDIRVNGSEDEVTQPLGLRTVAIMNDAGFLLNGQPYPIHGVNLHQDFLGKGWAMTNADHDVDMRLIRDMGATAIRLAHYPQSGYVHDLADGNGILLWDEIPLVWALRDSPGYVANAKQQLREMLLQLYNHPSVAFWGLFNEIGQPDDRYSDEVLGALKREQQELDPSRISVGASCNFNLELDKIPDWICYNPYLGWYNGMPSGLSKYIDDRFAENGDRRIGLSEYGAGGNPFQHAAAPVTKPRPFGQFHPEEWQSFVLQRDWEQIRSNPKLWGSFIWCMFDFDSSHRNEGGQPGVNDKGLVTADRQIRKDAFYFFQANWTDEPMVHIAGRRMLIHKSEVNDIEVYSNCPQIDLTVNGVSFGPRLHDSVHVFLVRDIHFRPGTNVVTASIPGTKVMDRVAWVYEP